MHSGVVAFAIALATVAVATPGVRRLAIRLNLVDQPSARRFHQAAVPLAGGVAILLGWWLGAGWVHRQIAVPEFQPFWIGSLGALLLGLVDDARGLPPLVKLAGQVALAVFLVGAVGPNGLGWAVVAGVWVVGLMNACNFLDNMDGILAGSSCLSALAFWVVLAPAPVAALAAATTGACLGFLFFNFAPARVFMGDAGSLALGYLLGGLSLLIATRAPAGPAWVAVALALCYPLFDLIFVTWTRIRDGRKFYLGGRDHTSHRLNSLVASPHRTALGVYALAAAGAMAAVVVDGSSSPTVAIVLAVAATLMLAWVGVRLARVPIR